MNIKLRVVGEFLARALVLCSSLPMNDGSALPTLQVNEREAEIRLTVRRINKEQLEENELCYVAWGAYFYDNISTLRDGMRCTESKLTFVDNKLTIQAFTSSPV